MCTLIVHHRPDADPSLVVGANRNEHYERPSSPPSWWIEDRDVPMFAPRDERAGGTWIGVNAEGTFAGLTNRFGSPPAPDRRSRGELVPRALEHRTARNAASTLESLDPTDYNPFHLVVADDQTGWLVVSDGELLTTAPLEPGLTILTERSFGAADARRKVHARRRCLDHLDASGTFTSDVLRSILSTCQSGSMDAICVDIPEMNYGTKSSTILRLGLDTTRYLHAEGAPCDVDYDDVSASLGERLE